MRNLFERRVDELIIAPAGGSHAYIDTDLPKTFPIVAVNRSLDIPRCGAVLLENEKAARTAVEYLIALGNTRIGAVVASPELMTSAERLIGVRAALTAAGLPIRAEWLGTGRSTMHPEGARAAALRILARDDRPTGLVTSSSRISEGVLIALKELGLRHGLDVHIVGFDHTPWAVLLDPPMAVVEQPAKHMGRDAMRMLAAMINGTAGASIKRLPGKLITHREIELQPHFWQAAASPDPSAGPA